MAEKQETVIADRQDEQNVAPPQCDPQCDPQSDPQSDVEVKPKKPRKKYARSRTKSAKRARAAARKKRYIRRYQRIWARKKRRKHRFMSYEGAKMYLKHEYPNLSTENEFRTWMLIFNVKHIPRRPERYYEEWMGWPDFLPGKSKKILYSKTYLSFDEALMEANKLGQEVGMKSGMDWNRYYWRNRDRVWGEMKLPYNPNIVYADRWEELGDTPRARWKAWVGYGVSNVLAGRQSLDKILAICKRVNRASNVLEFVVSEEGYSVLRGNISDDMVVMRLYRWEYDIRDKFYQLVTYMGSMQDEGVYLIENVDNFFYECDMLMGKYVPPQEVEVIEKI